MTKRRIEKKIEEVEQLSGKEEREPPIIMDLTAEPETELERTLATKPFPEHSDRKTVAIPKVLPRRFWTESGFLTVVSKSDWDNYLFDEPDGADTVFVVDLWESLTDDELAAELAYRGENGEQIPPYLEEEGQ